MQLVTTGERVQVVHPAAGLAELPVKVQLVSAGEELVVVHPAAAVRPSCR